LDIDIGYFGTFYLGRLEHNVVQFCEGEFLYLFVKQYVHTFLLEYM